MKIDFRVFWNWKLFFLCFIPSFVFIRQVWGNFFRSEYVPYLFEVGMLEFSPFTSCRWPLTCFWKRKFTIAGKVLFLTNIAFIPWDGSRISSSFCTKDKWICSLRAPGGCDGNSWSFPQTFWRRRDTCARTFPGESPGGWDRRFPSRWSFRTFRTDTDLGLEFCSHKSGFKTFGCLSLTISRKYRDLPLVVSGTE